MIRNLRAVVVGLAVALFALTAAVRVEAASQDEARQMCLKAAEVLEKTGKEKAYAQFHDAKSEFFKGELYVFVVNFEGAWEAYGPKPAAVGQNLLTLKDVDGKEFVKEMIELAKSKGEGWVEYQWKNPETNKTQPKVTYIKRVGDVFVGVGVYK